MTLQASFSKGNIIKYNLKRYWWISALSFIFIFLATILRIVLSDYEYYIDRLNNSPESYANFFLKNDISIYLLVPTISVIIAVCVMRYMQSSKSATLMHSLPKTRSSLYFSTFVSGLILYSAPILLATILLGMLSLFTEFGCFLPFSAIGSWCAIFLLYGLVFYALTIFVGMFTGSSVAQFIFTYIILGLPFAFYAINVFLLEDWLYAYTAANSENVLTFMLKISPIHYIMAVDIKGNQFFESWMAGLMLFYIVFLYSVSLYLYKKRNIETSGDIVTFKMVKPVFLYGVTIMVSLVGAGLIKAMVNSHPTSLIALFLWATVGYCAAKMLLIKSFRIGKYYKGLVAVLIVLALFWIAVEFNLTGYGKSVPEEDEIDAAYIGMHYTTDWEKANELGIDFYHSENTSVFREKDNIDAVCKLHQKAIDENFASKNDFISIHFSYKMKNGRLITRKYEIPKEEIYELYSTDEAKDYMYPLTRKHRELIRYINVNLHGSDKSYFIPTNMLDDFLDALCEDISSLSYRETSTIFEKETTDNYRRASVEFTLVTLPQYDYIVHRYMTINENYINALNWLDSHQLEPARYDIDKSYTD